MDGTRAGGGLREGGGVPGLMFSPFVQRAPNAISPDNDIR
jgi:hypothetical protein